MRWFWSTAALLSLAACVTINVYFPAAAAEKAADKFINGVIGAAGESKSNNSGETAKEAGGWTFNLSPFAAAHAQANIDIDTPAIDALQERMAQRFRSTLEPHFDSGAVGLSADGLVALHDAAVVPLAQRSKLNAAVADENRDRAAVYQEIANANGHPDWEPEIRQTFARRWIERARTGWYYQDGQGSWQRKN